jgi:hypothetical protein
LDVAEIKELVINKKAFKKMCNLLILKVFNGTDPRDSKLHVPEEMELPSSIRLLHWEAYPRKSFRFGPENLVTLNMEYSELEKLWKGTQVSYLRVLMGNEIFDVGNSLIAHFVLIFTFSHLQISRR